MYLVLSFFEGDVSEGNIGVLRDDQVSFFFACSIVVRDDVIKCGHGRWDQRLESVLRHGVRKASNTIGTVLSDIEMILIVGTGPFANFDELGADFINHELVLNFALFDEVDEEESGVLDLLWRDDLVLGHDGSIVWLDTGVHDSGSIFLINGHYSVAAFSNICGSASNLINGGLDSLQILFIDLSPALFFLNLFHVNFLLFADILQASLHEFAEGLKFGGRLEESTVFVIFHHFHAVEQLLKVQLQVFQATLFTCGGEDVEGEMLKELVKQSVVALWLLSYKDKLKRFESVLAENSSMRVRHMLLQKWQNLLDEWLEAVTHGSNDSKNMVEGSSLGENIAGIEKDSLFVFHASQFELEGIKSFMGGLNLSIFLDDVNFEASILHEFLQELRGDSSKVFLEVEGSFGEGFFDSLILRIILGEIVIEEVEHLLSHILNDWHEFLVVRN